MFGLIPVLPKALAPALVIGQKATGPPCSIPLTSRAGLVPARVHCGQAQVPGTVLLPLLPRRRHGSPSQKGHQSYLWHLSYQGLVRSFSFSRYMDEFAGPGQTASLTYTCTSLPHRAAAHGYKNPHGRLAFPSGSTWRDGSSGDQVRGGLWEHQSPALETSVRPVRQMKTTTATARALVTFHIPWNYAQRPALPRPAPASPPRSYTTSPCLLARIGRAASFVSNALPWSPPATLHPKPPSKLR